MNISQGTQLGRYEIRSKLGSGGMGEVYLALDTELARIVALKILPAEFTTDHKRLQRFFQEARAASALNHPNILTVHEIGQANSLRFIATEFVEGLTLRELLSREPLTITEALDVAVQVASALSAAHKAGIVHRDIKPENIMIRSDRLIKVLDFGLAKLTEHQSTAQVDTSAPTRALVNTEPGVVMGTSYYMSPEQARGQEVDARTDIWSLGCVLYEMLTGRPPFTGETTTDVIAAIVKTPHAPLTADAPEVPPKLEEIVAKMLEKDREERYQGADDLLVDLRRLKKRMEFEAEMERTASPSPTPATKSGANGAQAAREAKTETLAPADTARTARPTSSAEYIINQIKRRKRGISIAVIALLLAAAGLTYLLLKGRQSPASSDRPPIESIAVLPFVNASGSPDVEYLSDGMTDSLITSLSQLPKLSVKARSSVFRYKGRDIPPQQVGRELNVQAVLSGRVAQRGDDLALHIELVDAQTETALWSEDYNRPMTNLVQLQGEIARDVSNKLRLRLSGADVQRLTKNHTANTEAYQLYLKGRYHALKATPPEIETGVSNFQQAIAIDPNYALAYVGLADAYRSLPLNSDMSPNEFFPRAKAAAQKAVTIDDDLAEAHAVLGFTIFWYDWDWEAAENQYRRALELDPNSADAHIAYAHLLSNAGRHAEALAEAKRARELDPLNLRINALEGLFLIDAGRTDEALARLQKTFELDPNYLLAHFFAWSAYIEKGMYGEAAAEARRARQLNSVSSQPGAYLGYALAKSGKQREARAELEGLLKLSAERYVPPYFIALLYDGLGERDEALAWLGRGFEQRDPRMTFLKVEPKWNNLRSDPRFQDLMRRVGFPQ